MSDTKHVCWLTSVTKKFGIAHLWRLQYTIAPNLIQLLMDTEPDMVLYLLIELLEHRQFEKLREVGADPTIRQMWQSVETTMFSADAGYKYQLEVFFGDVSPEPYG